MCAATYMSNNNIANLACKMSELNGNEVTSVICRNIKPDMRKITTIGLNVIWHYRGARQGIIVLQ